MISRTSRIEPAFIKRLIEKEVDPEYYSELDCLGYNDIANCKSTHYDLIISDTVTQNYSCKVYSYHESRFHLHNLNDFIRSSRNLCQGILHEVHALPLDLNDHESIAGLFRLIQKSWNLSDGQLRDAFVSAENDNGKIITVLYNPAIQVSRLIVGRFTKKVIRRGIRCSAYLFLAAAIKPDSLRFFNVLLHELAYDQNFLEALIAEPKLEKINQHMNRILK